MGYRYNDNGEIIIYEPEAKIIQRIYKLYLEGYGCAQIAEFLTNTKVLNRIGICKWERSTIRNILRNEKYVGDFLFQKTFSESPLTHKVIVNHGYREQYLVENGHPAIINREDWNKVQEKMSENARKFGVPNYEDGTYNPEKRTNLFSGFVICPHCKSNYVFRATRHGGVITNRFLACSSNMSIKSCKSENYPYDEFYKILIEALKSVKKNKNTVKTLLNDCFSDNSQELRTRQIAIIDEKIEAHRSKVKEIEKFNDEFYMKARNNLLRIISDLTKEKIHLTNENLTAENIDSRINRIIKAINSLPDTFNTLDDINFRDIFSKAVIVDKSLIYFIMGNPNMDAYPKRTKLVFQATHQYKVRKTITTTTFGILMNR